MNLDFRAERALQGAKGYAAVTRRLRVRIAHVGQVTGRYIVWLPGTPPSARSDGRSRPDLGRLPLRGVCRMI
jgi:hypothetical protein